MHDITTVLLLTAGIRPGPQAVDGLHYIIGARYSENNSQGTKLTNCFSQYQESAWPITGYNVRI